MSFELYFQEGGGVRLVASCWLESEEAVDEVPRCSNAQCPQGITRMPVVTGAQEG